MKEIYITTINELRKNINMDKAHKLVKININDPIYKSDYAMSICNIYIELLKDCQKSEAK